MENFLTNDMFTHGLKVAIPLCAKTWKNRYLFDIDGIPLIRFYSFTVLVLGERKDAESA